MFSGKTLLITGGTGSFGNAVLSRFLHTDIAEIRIFSRDEKKQDDMRKRYNNPKLKFYIGDVRDSRSLTQAFRGVDCCFHAAALKQVPSCEFYPMEAVRTNVLGTENVLEAAIAHGLKRVICLSTDKAVYPINAMGISKAMMEKVMVAASRNLDDSGTVICGIRLSGGQRQRIGIARALYKQASVLVFDEATSALDNATEQSVMDAIEGLNRDLTILLIAHRLTTVRRCDFIVELEHGRVVSQGTYEQLLECSPSFRSIAHVAELG